MLNKEGQFMKKETYVSVELEIIAFRSEDVITTSDEFKKNALPYQEEE